MTRRDYGRPVDYWTAEEDERLIKSFDANQSTIEEIGRGMGRSGASVRARLARLRMSGKVQRKRQGTRKRDVNPTSAVDIVFAVDMLIDTRLRRAMTNMDGPGGVGEAALDEADLRCKNAVTNLEDVLERWKR